MTSKPGGLRKKKEEKKKTHFKRQVFKKKPRFGVKISLGELSGNLAYGYPWVIPGENVTF